MLDTSVICEAIEHRLMLRLRTSEGDRLAEPYIHGFDTTGEEQLLCFQVDGPSRSGRTTGWKTLRFASIVSAEPLTVVSLRARDEYAGYGRGFRTVHCQVGFSA